MRTITRELVVSSILLTAPTACGFLPTTKLHGAEPAAATFAPLSGTDTSLLSGAVPAKLADGRRDVSLAVSLDILDMAITTAIFGAAVAATVKLSGKEDVTTEEEEEESPAVAVIPPPKVEEPALEEVVEEVEEEVEEEEVAAPAEEEPAAAAEPAPAVESKAAAAPEKDISQLRNEVAFTLEEQREKERRLADARRGREAGAPPPAEETATESAPVYLTKVETTSESEAEPVKGGKKRRFVGKLVKKAVMPWKKWSNL